MHYLWSRLNKKWLLLALVIGIVISFLQLLQVLKPIPANSSPFTYWLSIDPFNFSAIIFFLLLPFFASLPAGIIIKNDIESGMLYKFKIRNSLKTVLFDYTILSFLIGFIVVAIPLLINFFSWFMVLPNVKPDNLLNKNILVINFNCIFVTLYYSHPFVHAILSILFASFWGGLFSVFTTVTSLWIKNKFSALCSSLVLQIVLLLSNAVIKLPNLISYAPADFLHEAAPDKNLSLLTTCVVTSLMIAYCLILFIADKKKVISL